MKVNKTIIWRPWPPLFDSYEFYLLSDSFVLFCYFVSFAYMFSVYCFWVLMKSHYLSIYSIEFGSFDLVIWWHEDLGLDYYAFALKFEWFFDRLNESSRSMICRTLSLKIGTSHKHTSSAHFEMYYEISFICQIYVQYFICILRFCQETLYIALISDLKIMI